MESTKLGGRKSEALEGETRGGNKRHKGGGVEARGENRG